MNPIELRCPHHSVTLLGKLFLTGEARVTPDGNLVELACRSCSKTAGPGRTVVHRWDTTGRLVQTAYTPTPAPSAPRRG